MNDKFCWFGFFGLNIMVWGAIFSSIPFVLCGGFIFIGMILIIGDN